MGKKYIVKGIMVKLKRNMYTFKGIGINSLGKNVVKVEMGTNVWNFLKWKVGRIVWEGGSN